ncbi:hypothetical protein O181_073260 [Austropuccinia psidii MF-1]|uniref:Reverse transcriptase RNase H-like domain-containing protein n=1 Tax=Austropuccinia psidii MF-1 TaxID=1389203 RepID=A0A9Q3IBU1_9BASI|nr:hypothetical protein [Austropuccinia psidii MF-1]
MPTSKGSYWGQITRGCMVLIFTIVKTGTLPLVPTRNFFSIDTYQISSQDPLEELLNEFREAQFSTTLTSKQKLSLPKILRKNRLAFAISEEPLGKMRGHDIELYLDVERPYPTILRRHPYPESLDTSKEIEKHINELLEMDVIRKIGHNEIVDTTTPVLITWNDGKYRLCGYFRALNYYTTAGRYPIPRIPHALDKLAKAKYITKMDCMKGFHQNRVKPNSMKLLRIICHMGIYEYTRTPFGIKNAPAHFQRMMEKIFQEEILEGWMAVYIDNIIIYSQKHGEAMCNAACSQGLGAGLQQRQIVDGEPRVGVIFYISRQLKDSEARYGETRTECLCLVWALEKHQYYLEGAVFEVYTDCSALKSLLNMKTTKRHMLRQKIAIQEYRGNMTIVYKEGKSNTNADGPSRWPLDNVKSNPAYAPEVAARIPIHFMEIDRRKNFISSEWAPESGTPNSGETDSEETETPILGINSSELHNECFNAVIKTYVKHKQCGILLQLLKQKYRSPELEFQLAEPWLRDHNDDKFFLIDGLLYHREKHTSALTIIDGDHISLILKEFHGCPYMGHMSEDRTEERVAVIL